MQVLGDKQALLILEGTENADDLDAVLAVRGGCGVLITSRNVADAVAGRQILAPLEPDDAAALLRKWAGEQAAEGDHETIAEICALTGYLPLALRLAGRYLDETGETPAGYLDWLRSTPLDALDHGERRAESVDVLLKRSLDQVGDGACQVLGVVGALALAPFKREPLAAALDVAAEELRRPLDELVRYGLLTRDGDRYEVSHALAHTYARQRVDLPEAALVRLAGYYDALARRESAQGLAGYRRLDAIRPHLLAVLGAARTEGLWKPLWNLVVALDDYLDIQCHWSARAMVLSAGLIAADELENYRDTGALLTRLGNTYQHLGQPWKAIDCHQEALDIARNVAEREMEGQALGNLGNAYKDLGFLDKAISYDQQALAIAREIGHSGNEALWLGNLGNVYAHQGQLEEAIECYQQALSIARKIGDRRNEGNHLGNMGLVYETLGRLEEALNCHRQALAIAKQLGHRRNEAINLGNIGSVYEDLGRIEEAIDHYESALAIAQEISDRRAVSCWLGNLGIIYRHLGQLEKAVSYQEKVLVIAREIEDPRTEAFSRWNLGLCYVDDNPARAAELMSMLVEYEREIGHSDAEDHAARVAAIRAEAESRAAGDQE
jgi:tetratricopeptide (TPR) repeat protein